MRRGAGTASWLLAVCLFAAACATAPQPSPTSSVVARSSASASSNVVASPIASPSQSAAATFASVCGTITTYVADTPSAAGSMTLAAPGRDPFTLTIPAGRLGGGSAAGYVCVQVRGGTPRPLFDGFFPPNTAGFVAQGTTPATMAIPGPAHFVLPQTCAFAAPPAIEFNKTVWFVDCGTANNEARGTLGAALAAQGWTSCGPGLATASWTNEGVRLTVIESSLAPGDYPRVQQVLGTSCP